MEKMNEEDKQFMMRFDNDVEEAPVPAAADDLRLEKLSTRVTMISILIPVLIVVILIIAYLDIKKQVTQSEDTGNMTVQSLQKDVESRFSSLSVRQAALEASVAKLNEESNKALAAVQVRLKNISDSLAQVKENAAGRSDLRAAEAQIKEVSAQVKEITGALTRKMENVAGAVDDVQSVLSKMTVDLQSVRTDLNDGLSGARAQVAKIDDRTQGLQRDKIDKPAMDLAIRLETLKVEQLLKARIDDLQDKLNSLEKKVSQKSAGVSAPSPAVSDASRARAPLPAVEAPARSSLPKLPKDSVLPPEPGIEEQPLK